jgi:hypothetical protein
MARPVSMQSNIRDEEEFFLNMSNFYPLAFNPGKWVVNIYS